MLREVAETIPAAHPGMAVHTRQVAGGGAATVVDESHHADLVVIGSRGLGGFAGLLLSSVSAQVAAHAHCPVIVAGGYTISSPSPGSAAEVDIDGESAFVLRENLEELAATPATTAVRLLPGYDQWVLGPGTADAHVGRLPGGRWSAVRQAAFGQAHHSRRQEGPGEPQPNQARTTHERTRRDR